MIKGFCIVLAALGLFFSGFGVIFIMEGSEARSWPAAQGLIVSTDVRSKLIGSASGNSTESAREARRLYYPEITYSWTVDGRSFTGSRFALGETHPDYSTWEEAREAARQFPADRAIDVFYDSAEPDQAVLDRSLNVGVFMPFPLGLFFLAAGIVGLRWAPALEAAAQRGARLSAEASGGAQ